MKSYKRVFFKPSEDQKILKLKAKNPNCSWSFIAKKIKGKTAKQCNDRYNKHLRQQKNKSPWTTEEDNQLEKLVSQYGHNWVTISKIMATRTNIEVKNRWSVIERKRKRKDNNDNSTKYDNDHVLEEILMSANDHDEMISFDKDNIIESIYDQSDRKKDELGFGSLPI